MEIREHLSFNPDGTHAVVFTQRKLADESWYNLSSRPATPNEIMTKKIDDEPAAKAEPEAPKVTTGSDNEHAKLAPSSSKQWTKCTISPAYIEANKHRIPKDTGSPYASEGTEAHLWAAKLLQGECALLDVPSTFRAYVGDYATHCMSLTPKGVKPLVEVKVPTFYPQDKPCTCDFGFLTDDLVVVDDFKYGAGVLVRTEENTQIATYGMSLIRQYEEVYNFSPDTVVHLGISQPRHREAQDQKPWVLSLADFESFCETEIAAPAKIAQAALDIVKGINWPAGASCKAIASACPDAKFAPGEGDDGACRWCKAKAFCEVRLNAMTEDIPVGNIKEMLAEMPDLSKEEKKLPVAERIKTRITDEDVEPLDDEFLVALYAAKKPLTAFFKDVEEYLEERALRGDYAPGVKLVMGREGNRAWRNEEEAETFLKGQKLKQQERYDFKLKSPTKVEEILKDKLEKSTRTRNRFLEMVERSPARQVLALESDKREAVGCAVSQMPMADDFEI